MTPLRLALALVVTLPLAVAACGVPDLVAHGVKSYERTQDASRTAANTPPPAQQPAPAAYRPEPQPAADTDFAPAPAPQRESVTSEPLR